MIGAQKDGTSSNVVRRADRSDWPAKILVAEDNPVNQRVLAHMLSRENHQFDVAENGSRAVELAQANHYDLILMDCQMPLMDGFEATRAIRSGHGPNAFTAIVAVTANVLPEDRQRCLEAGMNDHLSKPLTIRQLSETLRRWVAVPSPYA